MSKTLLHSDNSLIEFFFYTFQNLLTYAINKKRRSHVPQPPGSLCQESSAGSAALAIDLEIELYFKEINKILNTDVTLAIINKTAAVQSPRLHLLEMITKVLDFLYNDHYQPKHANKDALKSLRREISNLWESDLRIDFFQSLPVRNDEYTKVQNIINNETHLKPLLYSILAMVQYRGIKERCLFQLEQLKREHKELASSIQMRFLDPLYQTEDLNSYSDFIVDKCLFLSGNDVYKNNPIRYEIINLLLNIYTALSNPENHETLEPSFTAEQKTAVETALNNYIALQLKSHFMRALATSKLNQDLLTAIKDKLRAVNNQQTYEQFIEFVVNMYQTASDETTKKSLRQLLNIKKSEIYKALIKNNENNKLPKDNPISYTALSNLDCITQDALSRYKNSRENDFYYRAIDIFYNSVDGESPDNRQGRITTVSRVMRQLSEGKLTTGDPAAPLKKPYQYNHAAFLALLKKEIHGQDATIRGITNKKSTLRWVLGRLLETTASELSDVFNKNDEAVKQCTEIANEHFNISLTDAFNTYIEQRGTNNILKSIWHNGPLTTFKELIWGSRTQKESKLSYTSHFINRLEGCQSSSEYTWFIIEAIAVIKKIQKSKTFANSKLVIHLLAAIDAIIERYLIEDKLPKFLPSEIVQIYLLRNTIKLTDDESSLLSKFGLRIKQTIGIPQFKKIKKNCFPEKNDLEKLLEVAEQRIEFGLTELRNQNAKTNITTFNEELKHQLFAALMGSKVITSGYIAAKSGSEAAAGAVLEDVAKVAEIAGAPGAPTVLKLAGALLEYDDKQKVHQRNNNNASTFNTCEKLDKLVKAFANALTLRYAEQVANITPYHVKSLTRFAIKRVINFIASGGLQLRDGDSEEDIKFMVDQMVNAVSYSNIGHSLQGFGNTFIAHSNSDITDWTAEGLFSCDGIVVITKNSNGPMEKTFYAKLNADGQFQQPKYGYMVATEQEALHRGMVQLQSTDPKPSGKHPAEDLLSAQQPKSNATDANEIQELKVEIQGLKSEVQALRALAQQQGAQIQLLLSQSVIGLDSSVPVNAEQPVSAVAAAAAISTATNQRFFRDSSSAAIAAAAVATPPFTSEKTSVPITV